MRRLWSATCLIVFALFNFAPAFAGVVLPGANETVEALSFMPSALEDLENEGKFVLFDERGVPYGFVDNGTFTDSIIYGNLTITAPSASGAEGGAIIGSYSMQSAAEDIAGMRLNQGEEVDWDILRQQDFLKYAYYSQRYGDFETFIQDGLGINSKQQGIDFLNSLTPDLANEFMSSFEALDAGKTGYSQYKELLDALNKINNQDLSRYLDEDTLNQLNEFIENAKTDLAKSMLEDVLKNINEDELRMLYELLKHVDYKTLYQIARDYARDLARDGTLDELGNAIKNSGVGRDALDAFQASAKTFLKEHFWDFLPKNTSYYLLAAAVAVFVLTLRGVGG